jgi:DNA-damage-inducible protein D
MSEQLLPDSQGKIIVFGAKQIRRTFIDGEWFFSVVDIIAALTDSDAPSKYWTAMKRREEKATGFQLSTICRQLKLSFTDFEAFHSASISSKTGCHFARSISPIFPARRRLSTERN